MNAIVPRATVQQVCADREKALMQYKAAFGALQRADADLRKARDIASRCSPGFGWYNSHLAGSADCKFLESFSLPDEERWMKTARRIIDTNVWQYAFKITNLEQLMDHKAKEELHRSILDNPPEATFENITSTLEARFAERELMFQRGLAETFSSLDRRFKSHDAFKIGSRIILDRMFNESGSWSHASASRHKLTDVERCFSILDGEEPPAYGGIVDVLEHERRGQWDARQSEHDTAYFLIRCYKNGNCHLWFKRDDLVRKVNKVLAAYYGEVIADATDPEDDGGLFTPKTTPAKKFGFFPSPEPVAAKVVENAITYRREGDAPLTILEPSAGTGNLARPCAEKGAIVDCVELQADLALSLTATGFYRRVLNHNFLDLTSDPDRLYDRVVMNPPFDLERDIDHVIHALNFLKPDGLLVAVMSAGTTLRETRKSVAFRRLMDSMNWRWQDLPERSFAPVGTNVNTIIIKVWKDGRHMSWW